MPPLGQFPLWRAFLLLVVSMAGATAGPVISEFMADNKSTLSDENGDYSDWVEIYNPGSAAVNLFSDGTDTWAITCAADGSKPSLAFLRLGFRAVA
mgnify:CR=1 FL=1